MRSTRSFVARRQQQQHAVRGVAVRAQARRSLPPSGRAGASSPSSAGGFDVAKSSSAGRSSTSSSPLPPPMAPSAAAASAAASSSSSSSSRGAAAAARQQPIVPTPPQPPSSPAPGVLRVAIDVDEGEIFLRGGREEKNFLRRRRALGDVESEFEKKKKTQPRPRPRGSFPSSSSQLSQIISPRPLPAQAQRLLQGRVRPRRRHLGLPRLRVCQGETFFLKGGKRRESV